MRALCLLLLAGLASGQTAHRMGELAGEPTADSVILQSRLTATAANPDGGIDGVAGVACFEYGVTETLTDAARTPWLTATAERDYIVKIKLTGLRAGTRYFYRLVHGPDPERTVAGPLRTFRTLPAAEQPAPVRFAVVTGLNYGRFIASPQAAEHPEGYPGLAALLAADPDFIVYTGDNVYYDQPRETAATDAPSLRRKWQEQFLQPRFVALNARVPGFWEKDDHDHRWDDSDTAGDRPPASELGIALFREQVPVVDPTVPDTVTYRTHRVGRLLQLWLTEGRDYRSDNRLPDGPDKTLWGATQKAWLLETLAASDAPIKLLVSPTPLVGPDDARKRDNHTNPGGFRHEGDAFFAWLIEHGWLTRGFYLACGDRHWQYHSRHPSGFEEFSCGTLVDANSRLGRAPGDPASTDPNGLIHQFWTQREASGGFLLVTVEPRGDTAVATFAFHDDEGRLLYRVERPGAR